MNPVVGLYSDRSRTAVGNRRKSSRRGHRSSPLNFFGKVFYSMSFPWGGAVMSMVGLDPADHLVCNEFSLCARKKASYKMPSDQLSRTMSSKIRVSFFLTWVHFDDSTSWNAYLCNTQRYEDYRRRLVKQRFSLVFIRYSG